MDDAVALTGMEYGGITPIGIPADWALYVDSRIPVLPEVVVGAGIRGAKILLPGAALAALPGAEVVEGLAKDQRADS
jgi:prolyl-tRNA editing enzyme YbaK/EbsC (Cys-tRNA(Pro) deacylase)